MVTINFVEDKPKTKKISYKVGDAYVSTLGVKYEYSGNRRWKYFSISGSQLGNNFLTEEIEKFTLGNAAWKLVRAKKAKKVYPKYEVGDKYISYDNSVIYRWDGSSWVSYNRKGGGQHMNNAVSHYEGGSLDLKYVNENFMGSPHVKFSRDFNPIVDIRKAGIYRITRNSHTTLAAVGVSADGRWWMAPIDATLSTTIFDNVTKAELIKVN